MQAKGLKGGFNRSDGGQNIPVADIAEMADAEHLTFQVVLTKADKIKDHERDRVLEQVRGKLAKHPAAFPELILTSSEKGNGIATLRAVISSLE